MPTVAAVGLYVAFIAYHLSTPFVNMEQAYALSAMEVVRHGVTYPLAEYRNRWGAVNPEGVLWLIAPLLWVLGFSEVSARLSSLMFGLLALGASYAFLRRYRPEIAAVGTLVILTSPMFGMNAAFVSNDIYFFGILALVLCLWYHSIHTGTRWLQILCGVLWGFSIIVNPKGVLFLPLVLWTNWTGAGSDREDPKRSRLTGLLAPTVVAFLVVLPYLGLVVSKYGRLIEPHQYDAVRFRPFQFPISIAAYLFWLSLLIGPFWVLVIHDLQKSRWAKVASLPCLGSGALAVVLLLYSERVGEWRLPTWITRGSLVAEMVVFGLLVAMGTLFVSRVVAFQWSAGDSVGWFFAIWLVSAIILYSIRFAIGKYSIEFLLPLAYFLTRMLWGRDGSRLRRAVFVGCLAAESAVSVFGMQFLWAEGASSAEIARVINENGYRVKPPHVSHSIYLIRPELFDPVGYEVFYRQIPANPDHPDAYTLCGDKVLAEAPVRVFGYTLKRFQLVRRGGCPEASR